MVGRTLGHYRLLELVGQGGMAAVYRARDLSLDRECAVKVLHQHLQGDKESRLRFQREAQAVARLHHENILEIYAYSADDDGDESFIVAEFIHGPTLRAELLSHRPRFAEVGAMVGSEVARALVVAHREGIVHRDIKPENIMIRRDGTIVLCDFGIARILDKDTVTTTGQLLGSPAYMAPEHIKGQRVDSRSDLFSLGTMMYELVSGELPFRGKNPHDTITRIAGGAHVPLTEIAPLCSPALCRIIERLLEVNPDARYQEAEVLRDDLLEALRESGISDPRAELCTYFRDPAAWEAAFLPRYKGLLIETGKALRKSRRVAGALAAFGRARELDPDDDEVHELLASLARGNRRRRLFIVSGFVASGVAMVCGGLFIGLPRLRQRHGGASSSSGGSAQTQPGRPDEAGAPMIARPGPAPLNPPAPAQPPFLPLRNLGVEPAVAPGPASPHPAPDHPGEHPSPPRIRPLAPAAVTALHTVRLEPWPKAVRVSHNGRVLGAYGTEVRTVQLAPGKNEFLFENPACYSERVVLPPGVTPEEVRVRLRWKPALLLVAAYSDEAGGRAPLTADVLVDGRLVGRSGQVVALPIQGDDSGRTVDVQISAPGRRTVSRSLSVRANQLSQIDLALPPL